MCTTEDSAAIVGRPQEQKERKLRPAIFSQQVAVSLPNGADAALFYEGIVPGESYFPIDPNNVLAVFRPARQRSLPDKGDGSNRTCHPIQGEIVRVLDELASVASGNSFFAAAHPSSNTQTPRYSLEGPCHGSILHIENGYYGVVRLIWSGWSISQIRALFDIILAHSDTEGAWSISAQ